MPLSVNYRILYEANCFVVLIKLVLLHRGVYIQRPTSPALIQVDHSHPTFSFHWTSLFIAAVVERRSGWRESEMEALCVAVVTVWVCRHQGRTRETLSKGWSRAGGPGEGIERGIVSGGRQGMCTALVPWPIPAGANGGRASTSPPRWSDSTSHCKNCSSTSSRWGGIGGRGCCRGIVGGSGCCKG